MTLLSPPANGSVERAMLEALGIRKLLGSAAPLQLVLGAQIEIENNKRNIPLLLLFIPIDILRGTFSSSLDYLGKLSLYRFLLYD